MTVRETVNSVVGTLVPPEYSGHVERVITQLEGREVRIAESLRQSARRMGVPAGQVEQALVEAGLVTRGRPVGSVDPEQAAPVNSGRYAATQTDREPQAAQNPEVRNGGLVSRDEFDRLVQQVQRLSDLADRHLGSSF